jgi:transposase
MFVRYRKVKSGSTRVQIVENYRVGNKVVQKVLRHAGTAKNDEELEDLKKIAEYMKEAIEDELNPKLFTKEQLPEKVSKSRLAQVEAELPMLVNLHNLREEARIITGFHEVYGTLFDVVGYGNVLKSSKVSNQIFKDIVLARLAKPVSKRASCEMLEEHFGISYHLEQVYRMLDAIKSEKKNAKKEIVVTNKIPAIQDITFQYSKRLLQGRVTLFFYDCTTLYFESFVEDDLRRFGYSKDHKFNQGQVLLALTVTDEGLPVGYEVFAGNMYEGDTFSLAISKLKEKYSIHEALIVADSGLLSKENIEIVKASGFQYILGARLKNMSQNWQKIILENTEYETHTIYYKDRKEKEKDILQIKDYDYKTGGDHQVAERLIVNRSSARAAKDKKDRKKVLEKLLLKCKKSMNPKDLISNFGYKKYLKIEGETSVILNEEKIAKEELWDGLHGVFTNANRLELNAFAVLSQYHGLWQVEESFRIEKHDLRMRPVFHWSPDRIMAHIAVCFVAFSLIRFLQHHIKEETKELFSARRISMELNSVQQSILYDLRDKNNRYVIPSKSSENVLSIYKTMNLNRNTVPYKIKE